jgi:hypothetical protein
MYQKVRSSEAYARQKALNEIIEIAESLLTATGRTVLAGACSLHYLSGQAGVRDKPPFSDDFLMCLASDCDGLPVFDDFRTLCSDGHLSEQEPVIQDIADQVQERVRHKCHEILALYQFHKKDLDLLECELVDELE